MDLDPVRQPFVQVKQGSEEWFKLRSDPALITASKAAYAVGVDPYRSRAKHFRIVLGYEYEEVDDFSKRRMQLGVELEPVVRRTLTEVPSIQSIFWPMGSWIRTLENGVRLLASPDGFAFIDGELHILEIKTTGSMPTTEPKISNYVQCVVQSLCCSVDLEQLMPVLLVYACSEAPREQVHFRVRPRLREKGTASLLSELRYFADCIEQKAEPVRKKSLLKQMVYSQMKSDSVLLK